jgi:hypothetical protein
VFPLPVVINANVFLPTATLIDPDVNEFIANEPMAVLSMPVLFAAVVLAPSGASKDDALKL